MKVWRRFRRLRPTRGRISRWAGPASPRSWNDFWKGKIAELASGVGVNLRPQFQSSFVVLLKNERQKNEHTNPDSRDEKTEGGVAAGVGGCVTTAPREGERVDPRP